MKKPINSTNLWVTIISILSAGIAAGSGINIPLEPAAILAALATKQGVALIMFFVVNFSNPVLKLVKKIKDGKWSWDFLLSTNFQTQVGSLFTLILSMWFDEGLIGMILAGIMQAYNFLVHLAVKQKDPEPGSR